MLTAELQMKKTEIIKIMRPIFQTSLSVYQVKYSFTPQTTK